MVKEHRTETRKSVPAIVLFLLMLLPVSKPPLQSVGPVCMILETYYPHPAISDTPTTRTNKDISPISGSFSLKLCVVLSAWATQLVGKRCALEIGKLGQDNPDHPDFHAFFALQRMRVDPENTSRFLRKTFFSSRWNDLRISCF
jgi:hypothetical protein